MKLFRVMADDVEVATVRPSVPLATALLCLDCEAIYEAGGPGPDTCPRCASVQSWFIANRLPGGIPREAARREGASIT